MATIKVACPKCGQKVSGDESFYGTSVECPICSSDIFFPGQKREEKRPEVLLPVPPEPNPADSMPRPAASAEGKPLVKSDTSGETSPRNPPVAPSPPAPSTSATDDDEGPVVPPSPIYGAISIVSAVLAVVTCIGGILFAPIAIIFGHTALAKARHSPVQPAPGHTLGAIGLMIGYVSLVLTILALLVLTFFGETIREAIQQAQN